MSTVEFRIEKTLGQSPRPVVEIADHDAHTGQRGIGEYPSADEFARLRSAIVEAQSEVDVEDVKQRNVFHHHMTVG